MTGPARTAERVTACRELLALASRHGLLACAHLADQRVEAAVCVWHGSSLLCLSEAGAHLEHSHPELVCDVCASSPVRVTRARLEVTRPVLLCPTGTAPQCREGLTLVLLGLGVFCPAHEAEVTEATLAATAATRPDPGAAAPPRVPTVRTRPQASAHRR